MYKLFFILFLSNIPLLVSAQETVDFNVEYMLEAKIFVKSSIEDSIALGGFGESENLPKIINDSNGFNENGFFLKIDTSNKVLISDYYNAYKFFIVNKSDSIIKLKAHDSRINVIAEVYVNYEWQPIEKIVNSWCPNSKHYVYLKPNEYWEFDIPKFSGLVKTKLRYKLDLGNENYIYSNEIFASINKSQLSRKR